MKLKKIKILGRMVDIRLCKEEELAKLMKIDSSETACGVYVSEDNSIYLNQSLDPEQLRYALLHEMYHAMFDISGLAELLEEDMEEALCSLLSNTLDLYKNKEFINEINE